MRWRSICLAHVHGDRLLKILLLHNYYGSAAPSGENEVFEAERDLLESRGHAVDAFTTHSDSLRAAGCRGTLKGGLITPWNPRAAAAVRRRVEAFRPDIVHAHNTFPLLSPAVFYAVGRRAARVLTLHNYRLFCPAAIPMRGGRPCTDCIDRCSVWPALGHACYRGSRVATLPLAVSVALHRRIGTWRRQVDAFIALSDFQASRMARAGLPEDRVHVKPNFFAGDPAPVAWAERGPYIVFAGRLSGEKGLETLIRAWCLWGKDAPELRILGDGPLRDTLQRQVNGARVRLLGQVPAEQAHSQIAGASMLALPSEWFEGFPMVLREAFAFGTPAAVSDIGPLPSIVHDGDNGVVFPAAQPESLLETIRQAWQSPGLLERMGGAARRSFENLYTEDANYKTLMAIYEKAIAVSRNR